MPMRAAVGTISRRSPRRFASIVAIKKYTPVALPPGRLRLEPPCRHRTVGRPTRPATSACGDHGDLSAKQFSRQLRQPIDLILCPAVFNRHVLAPDIAGVFETLAKSAQTIRVHVRRRGVEEPNHRHRL